MKDRIRRLSPNLTESMIDDFTKIAALLASPSSTLTPFLLNLENALKEDAARKSLFDDVSLQASLFNSQDTRRYQILTDVLSAWAAANGFNPSFAKINHYLPPRVFRSIQAGGYLFNDKGSSLDHGEYTHSLQWYLITEANKQNKFLEHQPADLYIALSEDTNRSNLWKLIFDVSPQAGLTHDDYRCPSNLHAYLLSETSKQQTPILHAIISKQAVRMAKRAQSLERKPDVEIRSPHTKDIQSCLTPVLQKM